MFRPDANSTLTIDGVSYVIAEHPAAPGMPYGQEGRAAVVYQLVAGGDNRALKVFKTRFRVPSLVGLADKLAVYAQLPGLRVCKRSVLTARRHTELLDQHPDLTYSVLMPWIEGPTWMEVLIEGYSLTPEQSLRLARTLAEVLAGMEEGGLAHCDLSGANLLIPALARTPLAAAQFPVELVDVEQMYGPELRRSDFLPSGSQGYAHKTAPEGLWSADADRFAGAMLIAEMLGWCDERVRGAAWGENYFDPGEMQQSTRRYEVMLAVLRERWGGRVGELFERAWRSDTLADCATFGEWLVGMPRQVPASALQPVPMPVGTAPASANVNALMEEARQLEVQGNAAGALEKYWQALAMAPAGSALQQELVLIVHQMRADGPTQAMSALPADAAAPSQPAVTMPPPTSVATHEAPTMVVPVVTSAEWSGSPPPPVGSTVAHGAGGGDSRRRAWWALPALGLLIVLPVVALLVGWSQGWFSGGGLPPDPTPTTAPTITVESFLPTATSEPTATTLAEPTLTPVATLTPPSPTATSAPKAEQCKVWTVEHRGSRDTRFPPGFEDNGPYTYAGQQYRYKAEFVSTLFVDGEGQISSLKVRDLDIYKGKHDLGQVIVGTLISPSGASIPLFGWNCGPGVPASMHVTLDEKAGAAIPYNCTDNFAGIFKSDFGQLTKVVGSQVKGNWVMRLELYGNELGVTNYFNGWGLDICFR
ncbi:MAG TPA: hypothetical protein VEW94_01645 [Chloroflexia bacterium]|nr:hypothetical protein [Chloroflexia bacterium]